MEQSGAESRVALVTGAGLRVGRAIALALAQEGADVAVHFRTSGAQAEEVCREIEAAGHRAAPFQADLASADGCRALIGQVVASFGFLDWLVHSASVFHRASLSETTERIWEDSMAVNVRAGFLLAREAAPHLVPRRGRVVLMSDMMARQPPKNYLAHAVSKAAVEGLVRALAVELAPNVSVNGIAPGAVLVPEGTTPEQVERYGKRVPARRVGEPDDVARTVRFLCSGPAYITGQVIAVDGGQSLV